MASLVGYNLSPLCYDFSFLSRIHSFSSLWYIFYDTYLHCNYIDITQSYFNYDCTEHKNALRHRKFMPIEQEKSEIVSANKNNEFTGIFQYSVETIQGELLSLSNFYGKRAYLIVNVASQ